MQTKDIKISGDDLAEAVERVVFHDKEATETEVNKWIAEHGEEVKWELQMLLRQAIVNHHKPAPAIKEPVLSFDFPQSGECSKHKIELWVYDSFQPCYLPGSKHALGNEPTAGLVYVDKSVNGYNWTEHNLCNTGTWEWITKWMRKGFESEGLLPKQADESDRAAK